MVDPTPAKPALGTWYHSPVDTYFALSANFMVYFASLFLGIGVLIGLALVVRQTAQNTPIDNLNAGLAALIGAVVGARLVYTLVHWPFFSANLAEIVRIDHGGLSPSGAIIGSLAGVWTWSRYTKVSKWALSEALLPLASALLIAGWLGCWVEGCGYGAESAAWWALPAPDESGWTTPRIPVQLIAILATAVVYWGLTKSPALLRAPGQLAGAFLAGISVIHFGLTYLRADPVQVWFGLRWDAWSALAFLGVGVSIYRLAGAQST